MSYQLSLDRRAIVILSKDTARAADLLLQSGWYVENIEEGGLGYLMFALDEISSVTEPIGHFRKETANNKAIALVLRRGERRVTQRLLVCEIPPGEKLDAELITVTLSNEWPGWVAMVISRLDASHSLSLLERARDIDQ